MATTEPAGGLIGRTAIPLLAGVGVAATAVALHLRDPHEPGSWGLCPLSVLTGWDCPGCGGLRAVHHLTNADVGAAASSNLLVVAAIPFAMLAWVWWLWRRVRNVRTPGPRFTGLRGVLAIAVLVVCVVGFTLVRNTESGAWLSA